MEIPYEVTARRDTGLYNAKVGIWLFLASEVMLFGGLFSAYVFLRIGVIEGVDVPWPVSVQKVWYGFTNTLVLIASSVFVVLAWLALKARNWRKFQAWMAAVIACAALFMVFKGIEYASKFSHHGIRLVDNSVLEGEILDGTDRILFEIEEVDVKLAGGSPGFPHQLVKEVDDHGHKSYKRIKLDKFYVLDGEGNPVTDENTGKPVEYTNFDKWWQSRRRSLNEMLAANNHVEKINKTKLEGDELLELPFPESEYNLSESVKVRLLEPTLVRPVERTVASYDAESLSFNDRAKATGRLVNDKVKFVVHEVDLQMLTPEKLEGSLAWDVIGDDHVKEGWMSERNAAAQKFEDWYISHEKTMPTRKLQDRIITVHKVHVGDHGDHKAGHSEGHGEKHEKPSEKGGAKDDGHSESVLTVDRKDIKFMSNHGPRYHPYYAIYFTMTGLHGLHVIGGALVLAYFAIFGKKLYLKNPEHLANRVEVGGLFWHFVDLVWIFLFPIMYLL